MVEHFVAKIVGPVNMRCDKQVFVASIYEENRSNTLLFELFTNVPLLYPPICLPMIVDRHRNFVTAVRTFYWQLIKINKNK